MGAIRSTACRGFLLPVSTYPKPGSLGTEQVNHQHWCSLGLPSSSSSSTTQQGKVISGHGWSLGKGHREPFADEYVLYFDCGGSFVDVYICQSSF